jgi:hypothetical protein
LKDIYNIIMDGCKNGEAIGLQANCSTYYESVKVHWVLTGLYCNTIKYFFMFNLHVFVLQMILQDWYKVQCESTWSIRELMC